jgi:hypothetical protein
MVELKGFQKVGYSVQRSDNWKALKSVAKLDKQLVVTTVLLMEMLLGRSLVAKTGNRRNLSVWRSVESSVDSVERMVVRSDEQTVVWWVVQRVVDSVEQLVY